MNLSLRTRLFLGHALVATASLLAVTLWVAHEQRQWLMTQSVDGLTRAARLAVRELETAHPEIAGNPQELAHSLGSAYGARVTLIDRTGSVVGDSEIESEMLSTVENHRDRPEVKEALAGRVAHGIRHSSTVNADLLYVAVPAGDSTVAVVRVAQPLAIIAGLNSSLARLSAAVAAITLVVTLIVAYGVAGHQSRRIRVLEEETRRLGKGLAARAPELPPDEIGRLGRTINQMAADLRNQVVELERDRDERERILAHMSDGVALIDRAGRIVRVNPRLAEMLGVAMPSAHDTPFHSFARAVELGELIDTARRESRTVQNDVRLWSPRERFVSASATPLGSLHGDSVLLVLRDLSEVEKLNRVRQDFVANVSHELRTPLTSLRGYADTLLEGGLDDAERREEFVRIIKDQAIRLEALVDDLLSLAELERPGAMLRLQPFDLTEMLAKLVASQNARAAQAGLTLMLAPGPPRRIVADRARLEQVASNLLDNALKYTEHGGVTVSHGVEGEAVWFEVADTGPGIPKDELPRIFERFYRLDKARSREMGGTGLGLSIVKHIVALHGGEVNARSTVGRGSAFRVRLSHAMTS